ncbi:MAG: hypothetical protein HOM14_15230 [Gammaproteobacteria bacterium]|nr:hypothetical protein [Gammaproteobacteria bacterium]MBT3723010.1 hypothetical protein [Gammaproteobacteria bacterium]MBT4196463.1 hypothetical protein [Gammaproteobacteria bacterium]MBT4448570.1 hypothetical protein [Gammaproteobacteria bacterium]MBT4863232.1 hypothetical protein [Gammaproteobacteria bacterium]
MTASIGLKRRVAKHYNHLMPAYRLTFNIFSTVLIAPILWLSFRWASEPLWHWTPVLFWVTSFISAVTIIAFYFSLKYYDMAEFMGTRQWTERNNQVEDQEQFKIGEFHRFVRHPWYSMGIILIWCRELDPVMLTSAIMLTLYFVFGSRLEERKLIQYHGDIYRRYMDKVPGLIPRPWRYLSKSQVKELLTSSN